MPQLATICYIDNGKEFLMLHRNKKPNDVHEGKWRSEEHTSELQSREPISYSVL